jgi:hypothetical protein
MSDETRCPKCGGPAVWVTDETLFCTGSDLLARDCPGFCAVCARYGVVGYAIERHGCTSRGPKDEKCSYVCGHEGPCDDGEYTTGEVSWIGPGERRKGEVEALVDEYRNAVRATVIYRADMRAHGQQVKHEREARASLLRSLREPREVGPVGYAGTVSVEWQPDEQGGRWAVATIRWVDGYPLRGLAMYALVTGHLNVTEETVTVVPLPERSEP